MFCVRKELAARFGFLTASSALSREHLAPGKWYPAVPGFRR